MIRKIHNSQISKSACFILAMAVLSMSFKGSQEVVILKAGTNIRMETVKTLRSEALTVGTLIDFKVIQDVKVGESIVIPSGSIAKGQVVRVSPAKGLGKAGYVAVELKSVAAIDGTSVSLTGGDIYDEGENKETLSIVLGLVLCILFLTMKGENAEVPAGYEVLPSVSISAEIEV